MLTLFDHIIKKSMLRLFISLIIIHKNKNLVMLRLLVSLIKNIGYNCEIYFFNLNKCGYKTGAVIAKERSAIARVRYLSFQAL